MLLQMITDTIAVFVGNAGEGMLTTASSDFAEIYPRRRLETWFFLNVMGGNEFGFAVKRGAEDITFQTVEAGPWAASLVIPDREIG